MSGGHIQARTVTVALALTVWALALRATVLATRPGEALGEPIEGHAQTGRGESLLGAAGTAHFTAADTPEEARAAMAHGSPGVQGSWSGTNAGPARTLA